MLDVPSDLCPSVSICGFPLHGFGLACQDMPDFLKAPFATGPSISPLDVLIRLVIAAILGGVVSWIYCRTRRNTEIVPSFPTTLVLLSVLIAMVTQVIGDNVARAFSLVGALSIVRFRTVVRDTQDTAYVIFAVVVGMAVGAKNPWVAFIGLGIVGAAAAVMRFGVKKTSAPQSGYRLTLRVGIGTDLNKLLAQTFDGQVQDLTLVSMGTAKDGLALSVSYQLRLVKPGSANELVKALNRAEGVQNVQLERQDWDLD
jgi:hypothetical protein